MSKKQRPSCNKYILKSRHFEMMKSRKKPTSDFLFSHFLFCSPLLAIWKNGWDEDDFLIFRLLINHAPKLFWNAGLYKQQLDLIHFTASSLGHITPDGRFLCFAPPAPLKQKNEFFKKNTVFIDCLGVLFPKMHYLLLGFSSILAAIWQHLNTISTAQILCLKIYANLIFKTLIIWKLEPFNRSLWQFAE